MVKTYIKDEAAEDGPEYARLVFLSINGLLFTQPIIKLMEIKIMLSAIRDLCQLRGSPLLNVMLPENGFCGVFVRGCHYISSFRCERYYSGFFRAIVGGGFVGAYVIPGYEASNIYEQKAKTFYDKIKHNIFETKKLEELRDWLLPVLMNGQVTVND